jgi:hypothetical protein
VLGDITEKEDSLFHPLIDGEMALQEFENRPGQLRAFFVTLEEIRQFNRLSCPKLKNVRVRRAVALGLPVSKRLVKILGGDMTTESAAGKGSMFTLVLPWRKQ